MSDAQASIAKKLYTLDIPKDNLLVLGVIDVRGGKTSTMTIDFNVETSLRLVEGAAYFRPMLKVTTRRDATVIIGNETANISRGEILTDRDQTLNLTYPSAILNDSVRRCHNACSDTCSDTFGHCIENCDTEVSAGCNSDEDYCRKICEPLIHPSYCKIGCALLNDDGTYNDTIEACSDYLESSCSISCNMTRTDCDSSCDNECI